ncbi:MAG: hypothetical protein GXP49_00690 [Deltaproteobacteria bacterium]|nr:hypothetical protein [Deltaproteobacteria bacterium]
MKNGFDDSKPNLELIILLFFYLVLPLSCKSGSRHEVKRTQSNTGRPNTYGRTDTGKSAKKFSSSTESVREEAVKKAFIEWLRSAQYKDESAFKKGLSSASRKLVEEELRLPGEKDPYAGILSEVSGNADQTHIKKIEVQGDIAVVEYSELGQVDTITLVFQNNEWKIDLLSRVQSLSP